MARKAFQEAAGVFCDNGDILKMSEAVRLGVSRKTLYAMHDAGELERLSRGLYRLVSSPGLEAPDLVTVSLRISKGVICLISALAYHELTTQVPHAVDVAVRQGSVVPRVEYPPINLYWFSGRAFSEGVTIPTIDGVQVRIYSPEKSIADAFKYRHKIGIEVPIEALRLWHRRRGSNIEALLEQARSCRVESVMRPYLESLT